MDELKNPSADDHKGKDFKKFVYFVSKAKNYSLLRKPRVEEKLASGEKRIAKDDDGKLMVGHRIEFHNGMKRYEKTEENKVFIEFIREKIKSEKTLPVNRQMVKEIHKPIRQIPENEVKRKLDAKDKEIERLKGELDKKESVKEPSTVNEEEDKKENTGPENKPPEDSQRDTSPF